MVLSLVRMAHVGAVDAAENYGRATGLVLEDVIVGAHFFATTFAVAALELYFRQKITSDSIHLIELRIGSAERAVIRVLSEPVALAVRADRLLAYFALEGVLQYVVTHATYELGQECSHISLIVNVILLIYVAIGYPLLG